MDRERTLSSDDVFPKCHLSDIEQWSQSSGSNVIPKRARPGLTGIRPHKDGGSQDEESRGPNGSRDRSISCTET